MTPIIDRLIAEVLELSEKATAGPWYATWDNYRFGSESDDIYKERQNELVWTAGPNPDSENWNTDSAQPGYGILRENAALISHFRSSAPRMAKALKIAVHGLRCVQATMGFDYAGDTAKAIGEASRVATDILAAIEKELEGK